MNVDANKSALHESPFGNHGAFLGKQVALLALWVLIAWGGTRFYFNSQLDAVVRRGIAHAEQHAASIVGDILRSLEYLRGIPAILAERESVSQAVTHPALRIGKQATLSPIDNLLSRARQNLGADAVWLVDAAGICVASSNADTPESFVGTNYSQREYFLEAKAGKLGDQYAVGKNTGIPGLFFSAPIFMNDRFVGALVVKTSMSKLAFWVEPVDAFIADPNGVVVMAKDASLEMRAIPGAAIQRLPLEAKLERYARTDFLPLSFRPWGDKRFPSLLRMDDQLDPVALISRPMPESGTGVFVVARFPEIAAFDREFRWLFALLAAGGGGLIFALNGRLLYAQAERQAKRILAEQNARLDDAQRIAKVGSWDWDISSGRIAWSREAHRICAPISEKLSATRTALRDAIHPALFDAIHPADRSAVEEAIKAAFDGGASFNIEHRLGVEGARFVSLQGEVFRDRSGKPLRLLATVQDISERKWFEEELQRARDEAETANRAKSAFLASMSHEIRTPMNAILGYSQLMARDTALSAQSRRNLEIINRSGEHLLALINDILEMSKIEAGRATLNSVRFELCGMVRDLEAMFRLRAESKGLAFEVVGVEAVPPSIVADEGKVRQVLVNLLGNAVKFTREGGVTLRISAARQTEGRLHITAAVEDTGFGIAAEEMGNLFQRFGQTESGRQAQAGTGLGLAISREHARLMGGDIQVTSEAGKGSVFRFEFPVNEEGSETNAPRLAERRVVGIKSRAAPPRVLVVDDQAANRDWLRQLLAAIGFDVREATNGREAVEIWRVWKPPLVLMDVRMPGMDGHEATRAIRGEAGSEQVVIIALTASVLTEERQDVLRRGADDFIGKPVQEAELLEKIRAHLGLEYLHADDGQSLGPAGAVAPLADSLAAEALAGLPGEMLRALREATTNADIDRLHLLITEMEKAPAPAASALRSLVDGFDYEGLQRALGTGVSPH